MERVTQQKGFHSEEQWKIAKAIKDGFVSVQSEMWTHRGKLTCDMVHKKGKQTQDLSYKSKCDFSVKLELYCKGQGCGE